MTTNIERGSAGRVRAEMKRQIRIVEGAKGCTIEVLYPPFREWDAVSSWGNREEAIKALAEYERLYVLAEVRRPLKKLSKSG